MDKKLEKLRDIPLSDEELLERKDMWEKLFEKWSHAGDDDDEGIPFSEVDKFYEGQEEEATVDDEESEAEEVEDDVEEVDDGSSNLVEMKSESTKTTFMVEEEFFKNLKLVFDMRRDEAQTLNLPYWKSETGSSRTQEGLKENLLKTPLMLSKSREQFRNAESHYNKTSSDHRPQLVLNTFKIPQSNFKDPQLPPLQLYSTGGAVDLAKLVQKLGRSTSLNVSILEREYSFQFTSSDGEGRSGSSKKRSASHGDAGKKRQDESSQSQVRAIMPEVQDESLGTNISQLFNDLSLSDHSMLTKQVNELSSSSEDDFYLTKAEKDERAAKKIKEPAKKIEGKSQKKKAGSVVSKKKSKSARNARVKRKQRRRADWIA